MLCSAPKTRLKGASSSPRGSPGASRQRAPATCRRRHVSFVPRKRSGGEHRFYYPKRKAPPKSAFGVSFLRCDVTFSTLHHITHEKPKPPAIEEKYPHTFLFVMRNCHSEAQWGSDLNSYITNRRELKLATDSEPQLTGQARRSDLPPTPLKIKNSRSADHSVRSADQLWRRQRLGSGRIGKI